MERDINKNSPSQCACIEEVRSEIDSIDQAIIRLLSKRFEYVKEVVKYKDGTPEGIEAPDRRQAVLSSRRRWAEEQGLCPDTVEDIYDRLIQYFINEEKKINN